MTEFEPYMEAEGWKVMYTILNKGVAEAVDRIQPLPGNEEVCDILAGVVEAAVKYQFTVRRAVLGGNGGRMRERSEILRAFSRDEDPALTEC